jgi:SAM-dependent methyltransferase
MFDLSRHDPTGRFTGLADVYARCRPSYPAEAIDFVMAHCALGPGSVMVDIGSGTGISSRLFAERGLRVIGIEPNAEMRQKADREPLSEGLIPPEYRAGRAEATGLPDAFADAVLAAQAFHWFATAPALAEFHRILKPGGWLTLLWNERDESDPFTAAYGNVFRADPQAAKLESYRGAAGQPLLTSPLFEAAERVLFSHAQSVDLDGMLGRAFSASYAPKEPDAVQAFAAALQDVFDRFQVNGQVVLRYQTSVYVARRPVLV